MPESTVMITGGTSGLGLAMARLLGKEGYRVVACSRTCREAYAELMRQDPDRYLFESLDLGQIKDVYGWCKACVKRHGIPYALINNSAVGHDGVLATMHDSQIEELIRINLTAPILLTKYIVRPMLAEGRGRIINISSIIASTGFNGLSVYAASKAGLIGFTKSLAREVGRHGITVNAIAPGYMDTDMTQGIEGEQMEKVSRRSPLGRLARVEDVAPMASYLLSDRAVAVTGAVFTIDAGTTA
jgi:3-oxoacyl-[acyl-carrier protein] reductase